MVRGYRQKKVWSAIKERTSTLRSTSACVSSVFLFFLATVILTFATREADEKR
jgi:hypothetical protein